jgi:hypothetical protein
MVAFAITASSTMLTVRCSLTLCPFLRGSGFCITATPRLASILPTYMSERIMITCVI